MAKQHYTYLPYVIRRARFAVRDLLYVICRTEFVVRDSSYVIHVGAYQVDMALWLTV
jgi:hypothetical protein